MLTLWLGLCCCVLSYVFTSILEELDASIFRVSAKLYVFTSLITVVLVQITCLLFLLGMRFEVFVVVKIWIVVLWNCDLVEKRVLKFRVASIFGLQDGGGIFLWKVDNRLWNITLCDEDHSLNFPLFYCLYIALSITVYVCFRTWNENHVILIVRCVMPPCWVFFLKKFNPFNSYINIFNTHRTNSQSHYFMYMMAWWLTVFICIPISACMFLYLFQWRATSLSEFWRWWG